MLYKGADLIRDVEFVIFDEVHYVNDAEVRTEFCVTSMHSDNMPLNSEAWSGKRSSLCFRSMSALFCCQLQFQIPRSLRIGLGK